MINKPLINLFNEQLKNEIREMIDNYDCENEGQGFIWWYFTKILSLEDDEIENAICDGSGDLGIDAIIKDDKDVVHFYQFKALTNYEKGYPSGDVDKTISGLEIIIRKEYSRIANKKLKEILNDVLETIPTGYHMHFVSNSKGLEDEAKTKFQAFILSIKPPSKDVFKFTDENIEYLQDVFYTKTLPTLNENIIVSLENVPYMIRAANHDCYTFHLNGGFLADLYDKYGESLLQQNIRMYEGENPTNEAIYRTCTTEDSENFYHYNNGISILCDTATWDAFTKRININKPQIVNGGQTIRILHKAKKDNCLKENVIVPVRVITSQGDKEFAGNVAVNLNNQTKLDGSFLKSNNPKVMQLAASLRTIGWYLERREGEIKELSEDDVKKIEISINGNLSERTIKLKEGIQAYVATFLENPGLARRNPAYMFLDASENGYFNKIFDDRLTAENFAKSFKLYKTIEKKVEEFKSIKRKKSRLNNWKERYKDIFGGSFVEQNYLVLEQIVPQSVIFATAICYQWYILKRRYEFEKLFEEINANKDVLDFIYQQIIKTHDSDQEKWNKTWQTLLKSQEFFIAIKQRLEEIER
ncbi:AIPR family protein [Thermoanaerobacterium sp. R66]|uniref:AIPR family protein n=1 Tax=Thermoanaerobacterium sp. R66 TaxID=2742479 RepID=UPI0023804F09|nr:AIPR family protein [Thermoanaerobacterium sp. R66]MDE4542414.1 AIPR family protein [Thermoanaerobacterium sp. R66]